MSIRVKIEFPQELQTLTDLIRTLDKESNDLRPVWKKLTPKLRSEMERKFSGGTSPNGRKWKALSKAYEKRKRGGKKLHKTGKLKSEIGKHIEMTKNRIEIGVENVPYARPLQFGWNNAPARPFIGWSTKMMKLAIDALDVFVDRALKGRR